jgi:hypothetical protein
MFDGIIKKLILVLHKKNPPFFTPKNKKLKPKTKVIPL